MVAAKTACLNSVLRDGTIHASGENPMPRPVEEAKSSRAKMVDKTGPNPKIQVVRVAARFFSGVPHPHLLGVCCPTFCNEDLA